MRAPGRLASGEPGARRTMAGIFPNRSRLRNRFRFSAFPSAMNRRRFLQNAGLAGLGLGLAPTLPRADAASAKPADSKRVFDGGRVAVYAVTEDGATIIVPVAGNAIGHVEYTEEGANEVRLARHDGQGFLPSGDRVLRIRLRGLKPGRTYRYRVVVRPVSGRDKNPVTGATHTLRTLNPDAPATAFCVWNDTHDVAPTLAALAKLTNAEPADFLLWNGDISNNIDREDRIAGLFLSPAGGVNLAEGPPVLITRGNHDVRGVAANRLAQYIDRPEGRPYHAFRSGPVGAVVLDTGEDKPDDFPGFDGMVNFAELIREQAEWLAREIEKPYLRDAPYKVVFCHIPLRWRDESRPDYAKGGYDHWSERGRLAWHDALVKWGAQLVISGHTHERLHLPATAAFPYSQIVGGGPGRGGFTGEDRPYLIRVNADAKSLRVRLLDAGTGAQAYAAELPPLR